MGSHTHDGQCGTTLQQRVAQCSGNRLGWSTATTSVSLPLSASSSFVVLCPTALTASRAHCAYVLDGADAALRRFGYETSILSPWAFDVGTMSWHSVPSHLDACLSEDAIAQ